MMADDSALAALESLLKEISVLAKELQHKRWPLANQEELSNAELDILQKLYQEGPQTVPQLARTRGTSRQNVQIQVNRLRRAGMVSLAPNAAHKRSALVQVGETGEAAAILGQQLVSNLGHGLVSSVNQAELAAAIELLRKIRRLLIEREEQTGTEPKARREQKRAAPQTVERQPGVEPDYDGDENSLPVNLL